MLLAGHAVGERAALQARHGLLDEWLVELQVLPSNLDMVGTQPCSERLVVPPGCKRAHRGSSPI